MNAKENLTKDMRWRIAEKLADDRLPVINAQLEDVVVRRSFYTIFGKRFLDIIIALFALVITFPVNLIIGIITFFDVGRPVFFKQKRTGKDGELFEIIKFRNMRNTKDERGELLPPSQRVTKWGSFVRKTSLDELLNFWSILKGDMSVIGPRPLPNEYVIRYNKRHKHRLDVRPGLECPPRNLLNHVWSWQEQLDNDVWYVENVSLKTDLMLCVRLVQFALDSKSSSARSGVTRGTFMGYSMDGVAINLDGVPQEYIDYAFDIEKSE